MPTIVDNKTGESFDININKPPSQEIHVSIVSQDNPSGESPMLSVNEPKPEPDEEPEPEPEPA